MYDCFYCYSDNTKLHSNKQTSKQTHINGLHPYYKFTYDEDLDVYVFTLVIPYDD